MRHITRGCRVLWLGSAVARAATLVVALALAPVAVGKDFANFEVPHVSPVALTPRADRLLVVNTADDRLEVFRIAGGRLVHDGHRASVPVGLSPVSVRARDDREAWVVNHISDSISVVDLDTMQVVRTLRPGNEPADVAFVATPAGARAFVSLGLPNEIAVYDLADPERPPTRLPIRGHRPRALATDGRSVFAAIFEAGNGTTIVPRERVSSALNPYPGAPNPPPNQGTGFAPALATPGAPREGLIVRKDRDGRWRDGNPAIGQGDLRGADWSAAVDWDLHQHAVAVIDAASLGVSYVRRVLTTQTQLAVRPADGRLLVIGTEALNWTRFESQLNGRFLRVMAAVADPAGAGSVERVDLNPHLDYTAPSVATAVRRASVGDPRGIATDPAGERIWITGMGSNNVVALDGSLRRVGLATVGEGPTGIAHDPVRGVLYVLNRFEGSVSVVALKPFREIARVAFPDPTPPGIREGRPFLYDTHRTSGTGHVSCASCHVDARMDGLAWDLGDPSGAVKAFNMTCNLGLGPLLGQCNDWHPMKGPMTTQTLVGIVGTEPLHWRGDRENLAAFNPTFTKLLGADRLLTADEMRRFETFVATIRFPPNPNRDLEDRLRGAVTVSGGTGDAVNGERLFRTAITSQVTTCVQCHRLPTGHNEAVISANLLRTPQGSKVAQLRNLWEKTGFDRSAPGGSDRGFGFAHDGASDTLFSFLSLPVFTFPAGPVGVQNRRDIEAFLLSFPNGTHAGIGAQLTLARAPASAPDEARLDAMLAVSRSRQAGLVARVREGDAVRGYVHLGGSDWQADRRAERVTTEELRARATAATPVTFTVVVAGTEWRLGVDRDRDGAFDQDELDAGTDPADGRSRPGT
jgi:DNA-binding beta-propeller fold protein YncE/mono/diheme cytochrome c family protein